MMVNMNALPCIAFLSLLCFSRAYSKKKIKQVLFDYIASQRRRRNTQVSRGLPANPPIPANPANQIPLEAISARRLELPASGQGCSSRTRDLREESATPRTQSLVSSRRVGLASVDIN